MTLYETKLKKCVSVSKIGDVVKMNKRRAMTFATRTDMAALRILEKTFHVKILGLANGETLHTTWLILTWLFNYKKILC